ncbi:MAG: ATP-binding cassette domain-containing protein [Rhodospirillaceae bacterium]|nr:ATP-binding cassette domain-containing protein [Rhodospirillaceae bacterium]MBL6930322.1 ATP-binding cassette domain-containing protein [Rhodospirillales bacterium]
MAGENSALEISSVSFAYTKTAKALDGVSFNVPRGRFTALLGPNGAGKSTLISLVTRLLGQTNGSICIDSRNIEKSPGDAMSRLGIVFQQPTLDLDLSVTQNLRYFAALHGMPGQLAEQRIDEELRRFNMLERRNEKVRRLNGGHRRRVEIARALLHQPAFLLLDEPSVGLDIPTREKIVEHVHTLSREKNIGVLWATHLIDEIRAEDDVVVLHQGKAIEKGPVPDILASTGFPTLGEAFNKLTGEAAP